MRGSGILPLRQLTLQVMSLYSRVFLGELEVYFTNSKVFVEDIERVNQWQGSLEWIYCEEQLRTSEY